MRRSGTLLLLALLAGGAAQAQPRPGAGRVVLKLPLAALLVNTYGLEGEYGLGTHLSAMLSPRAVAGDVPDKISTAAYEAGDRVTGFGSSAGLRYYLPRSGDDGVSLSGIYFGLLTDYQRLQLDSQYESWGEELDANGLRYYVYRTRQRREVVNRLGGAVRLGYQCQVYVPRLQVDFFAVVSRLHSTSDAGGATRYNMSSTDYAYSGLFWNLGFNLGYVLR